MRNKKNNNDDNFYIEKDNYQDFIFRRCANLIKEYRTLGNKEIDNLTDILNTTADIISHSEYDVIGYANGHNNEGVYYSLLRLVGELRDLFFGVTDNYRVTKTLERTYKYITEKERRTRYPRYDSDRYSHIIVTKGVPRPIALPSSYGFKDEGLNKNFKTYYRIISLIVEDINDMDGWKLINNHFRDNILPQLENTYLHYVDDVTFLSYAFKDNIYALFLYDMFIANDGFLYVDSLFGKDYGDDGKQIKSALSPWIDRATQILFLHSIHSDRTKKGLSSWCSWELGEAYKNGNKQFFKVVVAGIKNHHSIIDDDFLELQRVENGKIIPKRKRP